MTKKRAGGLRAIGAESARATAPIRRKRGFFEASVFSDWHDIVGEDLARQCVPMRLVRGPEGEGGTLHVRVTGPLALELQHLEPQVIERINSYYGYRAVAGLRLHQGPIIVPERRQAAETVRADPSDMAQLDANLATVDDPELRRALRAFGESVLARNKPDNSG
ncbi:MAG: DciA family protein [Proteobacteria bacterium]|nr:DciA family protein [Pseudomonadota bacterium]